MPSKSSHERNVVEWQFVFASLWALCGQSRTKLTIPQTLLIRNGCAYKWLATDSEGYLNRKQVSPLLVTNARSRKQPLSSSCSPSLVVRKQLLSVVDSFGCVDEDGNDKSCIVCWYRDGRHEYVTRQELFKMALSDRWRLQLVGIQQGVVSRHRRLTGVSGAIDRDDTNKTLGDTSSAAANILASSIAAYIEKSYMDGYDNTVIGGSRSNVRLVVVSLVADFIVDDTLLWFSHAKTLVVRYSTNAAPSSCSVACRGRGTTDLEVEREAQNAGEKLRGAIRLALQRKTSIQHCFGHFDVDGVGYVGAGGLQDGLSKLGLEISDDASGMLMCWIARADGMHFCSSDLVDFALRSELRLGDNNNENRGDAPGGCVDDDKSGGTTRSRGNGDAANQDLEDQSDSAMNAPSPILSTFTVTRNNENGACVPFEVVLDNHHHIPNLPNDTSINSRPTEEWNVDTNENANEINVRDEKSGVLATAFLVDNDKTERGRNEADACASSVDEKDTPPHHKSYERARADGKTRDTKASITASTPRSGEDNSGSNPSDITPKLPPGAPSSSSLLLSPPTLAETPTLTPLSSPTCACVPSRTNNGRRENTAALRRAETHLMRQEDKLSLDAFRIDPNNFAAFQKAADEGRERARALRTLAKEEVILERTVDSGRQRAIKREQRRVAVTNAEESVTRLDLNALKQTVERLKETLRLDQALAQQRRKEEINLEGHLSAKDHHPNAKDQDQATNASSMLLVNEILFDISTSGQALRDVYCKQHQTRRRVEEYTNEIQSSERTVERLQEGLTKVSTGTPGTGTVSIAASLPFATQEQRIRLQRAKDKLERAVEQLDLAKKQLQWYDESVQASTVVFRQKQEMGKELLAWVESGIERSRGDVVQLRQQREELGNEVLSLKEKSRACQRRIGAIEGEMERFNDNISGTARSCTCSQQQQQQQQGNNRQDVGRVQGRYYFDTSLWHDGGLMQRMEGKDFIRLVEKERSTLRKDLAVHNFRSEEICQEMDHTKELLSANSILLGMLDSTRSRLYGSPFLAATTAATAGNRSDDSKEEEICPVSPPGPLPSGCVTTSTFSCDYDVREVDLASVIRGGKGHNGHDDILTAEEKEWLCLDYTINPHLYERRNNTSLPAGVPIVGSEIIRRLLNLPEQIQLALPYLRSKEEVRAHFLINKYTLGRGEKYFLAIDSAKSRGEYRPTTRNRPSTVDGIINKHRDPAANDAVEVELTSKLNALVKGNDEDTAAAAASTSATSSSYGEYHAIAKDILPASVTTGDDGDCDKIDTGALSPCVYGSFEELIQAHVTQPPNACFLLSSTNTVETLYDIPTQYITRGETQVHRFVINPSRLHVLHSIIITVVFQGTFTSTGYCPGRISASLARQHWCDYGTLSSAVDDAGSSSSCHQFVPIGYSLYEEQGINTKSSMGRIVIRHSDGSEAASSPVMPAHYEILVAAESDARYSISIGGTICLNAQLHLQKEMASFLRDREAVQRCEADLSSLLNDMRLAERQLALLDKLRREVNVELERCRNDIEQCDLLLEKYNGKSEMTGDDDSGGSCCCGDCDARESDSSKVIDRLCSDIKVLEIEYAQLSFRMAGRNRQRANMRSRLESMARFRHEVQGKNKALKQAMASRRKIIPLATSALFGTKLGADVANLCDSHFDLEHITSVSVSDTREGQSIVAPNASSSHTPSSSGVTNGTSTAEKIAQLCNTPAETVRRLARRDTATPGLSTLTVEERKFCLLDRVLYPSKWAWLDDSDNSALTIAALTAGSSEGAAHFVIPTATEILRIKSTPFDQLRRKADKDMKHLLLKYHDGSPSSSLATGARRNRGALAATKSKSPHFYSFSSDGSYSGGDVDDRCYLIQTELDRAMFCKDSFLVSSILNGTPQRFPTQILRLELERELDRLLIDQILSREQEDQKMQAGDGGDARSKCGGTTSNVGRRQGEAQRGGVVKASSQGGKDKRDQEKILFQRRSDRNTDVVDERELDGIENTVRFGLLLLVFGYFRSQHLARQQRKRMSGSHDLHVLCNLEAATPKSKREHERDDA